MKRILFLSCLFIVLHSSSAFCSLSVDDYKQMEIEGKEPSWNEITQDNTSYENWLDYLTEKTNAHYDMPSFSQVADLTANLLAYSVGNYADVASGVFDNLVDTFSLGSDIWDFMTFNVQQMAFDYAPDFANLMRSGVDDEIYVTPSETIGYWVPLPQNITFSGRTVLWRHSNTFTGQAYVTTTQAVNGNYHILVAYKGELIPGYTYWVQWSGDYTCGNFYQGSVDSGYYHDEASAARWTSSAFTGTYANSAAALADFFGNTIGGDPYLDGGIIVNDNPVINPLSLTSALGYPYKETIINNYNNNTPIPWKPNNYNYVDYNYNYDIPFWEGQELETIAYPEEIEFPSVEFETVSVDTNIDTAIEGLSGWIIEFLLIAILLLVLGLII